MSEEMVEAVCYAIKVLQANIDMPGAKEALTKLALSLRIP